MVDIPYLRFERERDAHEPAEWTEAASSKVERDRLPKEQTVGLLSDIDVIEILNKKKRKPD